MIRYYNDEDDSRYHDEDDIPRAQRPYAMSAIVSYTGSDGAEHEALVEGVVSPGRPATIRQDPDDSDPGEPPEVEVLSVTDEDTGADVRSLVDERDAEKALLRRGVW